MIRNTAVMCLAAALAVSIAADAADAKSKQRKRAATSAQQWSTSGLHQQPARMIEVRPGVWISSYGCITDEGYGRYNSCDITDSGR
jgi:hypothetical protein